MLWVAVLLLPLLSVLLAVMDRVEDHLHSLASAAPVPAPAKRRHAARKRHLRLVRGGNEGGAEGENEVREPAVDGPAREVRPEPRAA
ncbi:hypothetical protein [Streptomyces sp. NPDC002328]|uniref:hypothetical protein n=1 Tax=Streptomyces sp. NPDC002328 TaxID=3364642 RepID=UPI0036B73C1C